MKPTYIHTITSWSDEWDLKEIITDANARRRMSRLVKMGVATGLKCWQEANLNPEKTAIITATQYGCLTDSEKFLRQMITANETNLSPTPFIQSTFNTIGAQIALSKGCKEYNMTYVNREHSLFDALLDACMTVQECESVLLGYIDEETPTLRNVANRMKGVKIYDGAVFMTVTTSKPEADYIDATTLVQGTPLTNEELLTMLHS